MSSHVISSPPTVFQCKALSKVYNNSSVTNLVVIVRPGEECVNFYSRGEGFVVRVTDGAGHGYLPAHTVYGHPGHL